MVGWLKSDPSRIPTAIFLATTVLTSVTGFLFPFTKLLPSHIVGIISLVMLAFATFALYGKHLSGIWQKLVDALVKLGLKSAFIIGTERLHLALDEYTSIRDTLPNQRDPAPFRFEPDEMVEVIGALHAFAGSDSRSGFNSARDFGAITRGRVVGWRFVPEARHQRCDLLQVAISLRWNGDLRRAQAEGA
jgi:hypothetical protein